MPCGAALQYWKKLFPAATDLTEDAVSLMQTRAKTEKSNGGIIPMITISVLIWQWHDIRLIRKPIRGQQVTVKNTYVMDGKQAQKKAEYHTRRNMIFFVENICIANIIVVYLSKITEFHL